MRRPSARQEKFIHAVLKGNTQSEAYRLAYPGSRCTDKTRQEKASRLMANPKIQARLQEIQAPVLAKVRITKAQWLEKMQAFFLADVRKMFDQFGNPIEIPQLGDNEAAMVEGFEFCEEYTNVKKASGETDAVPTGYTKKYKLTPKLKAMLEFGRVMGWCENDEPPAGPKRIVIRQWVQHEEAHHVHIHAPDSAGNTIDVTGRGPVSGDDRPDGEASAKEAGVRGQVGTTELGAETGKSEERLSGAELRESVPVSTESHLSRRVVRREILPDVHDAERPDTNDL